MPITDLGFRTPCTIKHQLPKTSNYFTAEKGLVERKRAREREREGTCWLEDHKGKEREAQVASGSSIHLS